METLNLLELLQYIDPAALNYQEWINVGMALKQEGYHTSDWDSWSRRDTRRYHPGECEKKWCSFEGNTANPVTAGTIVRMAKEYGWKPAPTGRALDWEDTIGESDNLVIVNQDWIEEKSIREPEQWNPVKDLVTYLETLFDSTEIVGYVTDSWERDGKYFPSQGDYSRTAGELIQALNKCKGDLGAVLGDYKEEAGAWIRFNPLDGKGIRNENVTEFRYALVESDSMDIERQNAIIRELELPVACLVHSGKKSLHAIIKIDAGSYAEYQKRVDYLYSVCKKNGLELDRQNRNPSRLSRMPGVMRNGNKQFLVDTNIGKSNFAEWQEWIESVNDDLPDPESISDVWDSLPELSPPLIEGVLRQGHKMLLAGPSKAGKSFALIELCIAIAEGKKWFGFPCTKGRILYVNLELDRPSCLHRFKDVYEALEWQADNLQNIDIWNLRGKSIPMDKLAPKLIRRASKKDYIAIVIDPIYKIITGDENSADQMANFCNQFDKVCTELNCAVIYCHHHSKGAQGGKRSMDRASGSGVFARDPDALLDLIELEIGDPLKKQQEDKLYCEIGASYLDRFDITDALSDDDFCSRSAVSDACNCKLPANAFRCLTDDFNAAKKKLDAKSAWRIEGTLREFPKFAPINLWFDYPVHKLDDVGVLHDADADGELPPWKKAADKRKEHARKNTQSKKEQFDIAVEACSFDDQPPTVKRLIEYYADQNGVEPSLDSMYRWIKKYGYFIDKNSGNVTRNATAQT